jgi:hypothetical protein
MSKTRRIIPATLSACAVLLVAGHAAGQTALGDGRGLERNPQVGSGGYNVQAPNINDQIRMNNAIITGNAPGGRSFRGSVGYTGTSDFRGSVGSDTLYAFRRDSAISGAFGAGVRGTDALRYQFALSTGQSLPPSIAQYASGINRSGTVTTASNSAALRSTADFLASQSVRPSIVGGRIDEQGYEWTVKASPLLGVNWVRSDAPVVRIAKPEDPQAKYDLGAVNTSSQQQRITDERRIPGTMGLESTAAGIEGVLDREIVSPLRAPSTRVKPEMSAVHSEVMKSLSTAFVPGQPVAAPASTKPDEPAPYDGSLDAQLERLRRSLRGEPIDPAPADKRAKTQTQKPSDSNREREPVGKPAEKPDVPGAGSLNDFDPRKPTIPGERKLPERAKPNPGDPVESERAVSEKSVFDDTDRRSKNPLTPEMVQGLRSVGQARIESLVRPRVSAPGERRNDLAAYEAHMAVGQDALIKARYFDAEDRFTRAIAAMPGDPLAQAGRVHAQLGAGLFLSAAANLRQLFAFNPEMIGATYGENLVPSGQRAERIVEHLRGEFKKEIPALGKDAAFLMAYLGHIRSDRDLMLAGLSEMTSRTDMSAEPETTLLEACRAAWSK